MSAPYYSGPGVTLYLDDCLDVLRTLPDASVDAVVTDPPYGLREYPRKMVEATLLAWLSGDREYVPDGGSGFMGRAWDRFVPPPAAWDECFRVLKPGGHLLAFAGTRTFDLMAISIRLAGLTTGVSPEIRDSIAWLYGSGFPKSLDVSKAIDKAAAAEREVVGDKLDRPGYHLSGHNGGEAFGHGIASTTPETRLAAALITAPATDAARTWQGWGTALKPAFEPIVVARKPLVGTVAGNVLAYGTGALNVDGCRVAMSDEDRAVVDVRSGAGFGTGDTVGVNQGRAEGRFTSAPAGRWPANVVLDEDQAAALDEQSGDLTTQATRSNPRREGAGGMFGLTADGDRSNPGAGETGGASRFFYTAKADSGERVKVNGTAHPTVKPLSLMRWLVRLVTPPGGTVLEPFAGSGTTVEACILEGFSCIAVEREADYLPLIQQRINRRRDPVAAVKATEDDGGLFDLLDEGA